ncbi:MAG: NfeD family protein [Thermoproteus sp.]|nr:NfeD family protein [Thermoproteus sp.]
MYSETKRFKQGPPRPAAPIGEKAVAVEELNPTGMVKLHGVYWRALCEGCRAEAGEEVLIVGYKDGVLLVRK